MYTALIESIKKCTVDGNTVYLPKEILTNYQDVRKALINAGGTYKRNTFVFKNAAQPFIDRLTGGESVNIKKEFQFFVTPPEIANMLVDLAEVDYTDTILEPSAGSGALVFAINRTIGFKLVDCFELMPENETILKELPTVRFIGNDFLKEDARCEYSKIIANPPFSKNQDIDHILKMYECLVTGGRIVTVASNHWRFASNRKETVFREWLNDIGAEIQDIDAGAFKDSGTMISSCIIIINK